MQHCLRLSRQAAEMAQALRVLPGELDLIPSTMWQLTMVQNSCYRGSDVHFWPLGPLLRIFLRTSLSADANNFNQIKLDQIRDAHV